MPGITLCFQKKSLPTSFNEIDNSISSLLFNNRYSKYQLLKTTKLNLFLTKYLEYPFIEYHDEMYDVFLEGRIYGEDQVSLENELLHLASQCMRDINSIKNWINSKDGDFIVIIYNKNNHTVILFNDNLGRLPLYVYKDKLNLFVSREISFFNNLSISFEVANLSLLQYLFIGYPLGENTFIKNIKRINPATYIKINLNDDILITGEFFQHNLDENRNDKMTLDDAGNNLEELIITACKNRNFPGFKNIISLSGGLDSRSVISAFNKTDLQYSAATFLTNKPSNEQDVQLAQQIAEISGCNHKIYELKNIEDYYINFILNTKLGMNQIGLAFLVKYLDKLFEDSGAQVTLFTGDGGDKILPYISLSNKVKSTEQLTETIIASRQHLFNLKRALKITGVDDDDFKSELNKILNSYPESTMIGKLSHFLIFERGYKWLFEGEDRNRYWFWSVSPFYSQPFFNFAMSIPNRMKKNHILYKNFLIRLSDKIANVRDFRWGVPITSKKIILINFLKEKIYPSLPTSLKRKVHHNLIKIQTDKNNMSYLSELKTKYKGKNNWLSLEEIRNIQSITSIEIDHLTTIFMLQDKFEKL